MGVGLTIALLTSLLVVGAPASAADPLRWEAEIGPSTLSTGSQTMITGADVTDFAVAADGTTVYAISGNSTAAVGATSKTFNKSTNGGSTWARSTTALGTQTSANLSTPMLVAVAPGDANTVLVAGVGGADTVAAVANRLILSNDGGLTFSELSGANMTTINAIAISPLTAGVRYIAVAGVNSNTGLADVQYLNMGALVSSWKSMTTSTDPNWAGFANIVGTTSVMAIAFSPNFASDKVMVAVTNHAINGALLEIASFSSYKWNTQAGFLTYPKWLGTAANFPAATAASISLPATYLGADESLRQEFVAIATTNNTGGVYYVKDVGTAVTTVQGGVDFQSVAYNGTDLVAGAFSTNNVYYSPNPTATTPTVSTTTSYQRPGGATRVKVAWAGANVVAGTVGTLSAFAVSKDKGATFNDVSLIDDKIVNMRDFAVAKDAATVYLVSDDNATAPATKLSVWRKTTAWERVFTLSGLTTTAPYIVRVAPENADNVYVVNTAGTDMYYSGDKGEKSWALRSLIETPKDVAVESAQVVYALTAAGKVFKSINAGFTWDTGTTTGLSGASTIVSIAKDQLIVGGSAGTVAWSTDGSASATTWVAKTSGVFVGTAGNVMATANTLSTGGFIYVATDTPGQDIKRWKVGTSVAWDDIVNGTLTGGVFSIGVRDGVVNVVSYDATSGVSWLIRNIDPTTADSSANWSSAWRTGDATGPLSQPGYPTGSTAAGSSLGLSWMNRTRALQATTDGKVWVINSKAVVANTGSGGGTGSDGLYSLQDTVYKTAPTATTPADKAAPQTNPVSGRAQDIAFSWARLSLSTVYSLQVALDSAFKQIIINASPTTILDPVVSVVGPFQTAAGEGRQYEFSPGVTYYWRVKATQPLESTWSTTRSFTFSSLDKPFSLASPAVGEKDVSVKPILTWTVYTGAKWYELTVSEDPTFAIPEWSHNVYNLFYGVDEALKYGTTYYWRVRGVTADPYVSGSTVITPAGPYMTGAFTTMAEPVAPKTEQVIVTQQAPAPPPQIVQVPVEKIVQQSIPNWMLMTIIVIGAVLIIALIILIVRTRRVA